AQFSGLSYSILEEKGGDVYIIQTDSFGRCAIWAPRDNDSSITTSPSYSNGNTSGGGSTGGSTGNGKYLNLHAHMPSWGVYNVNGPYTSANKIGSLAPAQFSGLSYSILEEKSGDVYIIQTDSFGRCAIWAPRDNDSSITTSPSYSNGNTSGGNTTPGGGGVIIPGGLKVFIDPGHGGSDPGAIGNGLNEKDVVLSISKKLGVLLNARGVSVQYSRTSDIAVSLEGRPQQANNWGANLFVSIHSNAFDSSSRGTECYTTPSADSKTKQLSANVSKAISNKLAIPNRGHKEEIWRVLRLSNMPAILIETAFIDNSSDANLLSTKQDDFALAIANQIAGSIIIPNHKERIVVSGGEYDVILGQAPGIRDRYKYNFIDTAIKKLKELKSNEQYRNDKITWLIANEKYSQNDLNNFKDTAKNLNVNIVFFNNKDGFIDYINYDRTLTKIASLIVYSHGVVGAVEFGYGPLITNKNFTLSTNDISKINKKSFDSSIHTHFLSCNTATENNGNSFAKQWAISGLGSVQAANGRTDYTIIMGFDSEIAEYKAQSSKTKGYNENGARNYPGLDPGVDWIISI
ncbi:N-acetylmuramoyl-L-alanine amidase, partial [Clostridium gasigenes]|uniref:N-acetylmuramoyl-L-alanine amidase n=1 Tax=Clostridium gasigenes TaxID=94869 RepID=UPI001C0D428B